MYLLDNHVSFASFYSRERTKTLVFVYDFGGRSSKSDEDFEKVSGNAGSREEEEKGLKGYFVCICQGVVRCVHMSGDTLCVYGLKRYFVCISFLATGLGIICGPSAERGANIPFLGFGRLRIL